MFYFWDIHYLHISSSLPLVIYYLVTLISASLLHLLWLSQAFPFQFSFYSTNAIVWSSLFLPLQFPFLPNSVAINFVLVFYWIHVLTMFYSIKQLLGTVFFLGGGESSAFLCMLCSFIIYSISGDIFCPISVPFLFDLFILDMFYSNLALLYQVKNESMNDFFSQNEWFL